MTDLSHFDSNGPSNPKNNIFGLPFTEEDARLVILPVPWEVTVSYGAGTSRACEHVFRASMQVDLFDAETDDAWRHGLYMRQPDKKVLMKSDYLRKEAELYINFTSKDEIVEKNSFMCKSLKEINEAAPISINGYTSKQSPFSIKANWLASSAATTAPHSLLQGDSRKTWRFRHPPNRRALRSPQML